MARFGIASRLVGVVAAAAVAGIVFTAAVGWSGYAGFARQLQDLSGTEAVNGSDVRVAVVRFRYRQHAYVLKVPVSRKMVAAGRAVPTERAFAGQGRLRAAYLGTLVREQSRDRAVSALALQLRGLRSRLSLDSDEYVELMARAVQDLPYGDAGARFGLAADALSSGRAVCSGKSVLLSALLLHEGYDSAIVALDARQHAAAAVRGMGPGFLGSGYAYIETTRRGYVGEVPPEFAGAGPWSAKPQVIPVGGKLRYAGDVEGEFIALQLERISSSAKALAGYQGYAIRSTGVLQETYSALARQRDNAAALSVRLSSSLDDRDAMFRLLTDSGGR